MATLFAMNIQPQSVAQLILEMPNRLGHQYNYLPISKVPIRVNGYVSSLMLGMLMAVSQGAIATAITLSAAVSLSDSDLVNTLTSTTSESTVLEPHLEPQPIEPLFISQAAPAIQRGDQGGQVEALQNRLTELGYYSGPVTGFFGEATEASVIRFQRDQGLTADGIVGEGTANALRRTGNSSSASSNRPNNPLTLEIGDQGPSVETLQKQLTQLAYYDGPITGYFGPLTEAALMRFQSAQGLTADGIVGTATQSALDQALGRRSAATSDSDVPDPNDGVWEVGETGAPVTTIQRQLQSLGYYSGAIDGDFGSNTEAAVREFQRSRSLTIDGKAGPQTRSALTTASQSAASDANTSRISDLPPQNSSVAPAPPLDVSAIPTVTMPTTPNIGATETLPTPSNSNVLAIQRYLQNQGFYDGALDGQMGPDTQQALREAQQNHGIQTSDFSREQ